jgi:hypothetical protein
MSLILRWVSLYFRYGVPLAVSAVTAYVLFEHIHPWKEAEPVLPHLPNETRISVGAGMDYRGDQSERYAEYVYFPSHLRDAKVYVVRQHNNEPETLTEAEGSVASPLVILSLVLSVIGCIWFWRASLRKMQPNKSLERTRGG